MDPFKKIRAVRDALANKGAKIHHNGKNALESDVSPPRGVRFVKYTSLFYFKRASIIWYVAFCTLPLDVALTFLNVQIQTLLFIRIAWITTAVTILFMSREYVLEIFTLVRERQSKLNNTWRKFSWIGVIVVVAVSLIDVGLKVGFAGVVPVVAILVVVFKAFLSVRKTISESERRQDKLQKDRIYWVEQTNKNIFILSVIPMLSARLIGIFAAIGCSSSTDALIDYSLYGVLTLFCLVGLRPTREHFMIQCARCGFWTSRALKKLRYCPKCNFAAFQMVGKPD